MDQILNQAKALQSEMTAHRRWLHAHAETGFALTETIAYVRRELEKMGMTPVSCGKAGLIVTLGGSKPGKTILLRADMDALPIPEESGESFASTNGNMHACGHDLHTAILLGAAKLLKARESELQGTVKLMFQPAEEIFEGAKDMIANGVLDDPKPDAALMLHVTAATPMPTGMVIICPPGVSAPAADYFTIHVQGKGCHGSAPQNGIDALTAASHILITLQEIHARELAPGEEAVLTVGTFQGGTAPNVIADSARLDGTIRTYDEKTRSYLKQRMQEMAHYTAKAYRAEASVEFGSGCPTLVNNKALAQCCHQALTASHGPRMVLNAGDFPTPMRGGGSEDFAYVSQEVPALMLALAAGSADAGFSFPQHHPKVKFDEDSLPYGAAAFVSCAIHYLNSN